MSDSHLFALQQICKQNNLSDLNNLLDNSFIEMIQKYQ
jgi:hypothetical protein